MCISLDDIWRTTDVDSWLRLTSLTLSSTQVLAFPVEYWRLQRSLTQDLADRFESDALAYFSHLSSAVQMLRLELALLPQP